MWPIDFAVSGEIGNFTAIWILHMESFPRNDSGISYKNEERK